MQRNTLKPKDEMYRLHSTKVFENLVIDPTTDEELSKFVNETLTKGPKFANYAPEKLEQFLSRIYELRENNRNNTTR